jgi:hypothetical protein
MSEIVNISKIDFLSSLSKIQWRSCFKACGYRIKTVLSCSEVIYLDLKVILTFTLYKQWSLKYIIIITTNHFVVIVLQMSGILKSDYKQ